MVKVTLSPFSLRLCNAASVGYAEKLFFFNADFIFRSA